MHSIWFYETRYNELVRQNDIIASSDMCPDEAEIIVDRNLDVISQINTYIDLILRNN